MKHFSLALLTVFTSLLLATSVKADVNVLIVGSSKSFSEGNESGVVQEKAFNPTAIASRLQSILANDAAISGSANVVFEDIYMSKQVDTATGGGGDLWDYTYKCYSLMQYFMWPEGKAARLSNLRGAGGTAWDYVIIVGDPYLMANMPGVYAEGVKLLAAEISSGTAEPILLAQWPENSSTFTANNFNEIIYRVGGSAGLRVVPAGKAWDTMTGQDTNSGHPTPHGTYLAAASLYSELYDRNAKTSSYTYNNAIADHALSVVQANDGVSQYAGVYSTINPFQMKYFKGRTVEYCSYGSSTEAGFNNGLLNTFATAKVSYTSRTGTSGNPVDFSYSRGTDVFEANKQYDYQTRLDNDDWTYGFPMGDHSATGPFSMLYGIDKRFYGGASFDNGTDLGVAYSMIRENQVPINVRGIPVRFLWAKMNNADLGFSSHRDSWHLSNELDRAVGAFMYTLLSGRCPIGDEPADDTSTDWKYWFCRKLGYETAWQMSHLTTRVPGFQILPASTAALTVTPGTTETMTVQFMYPPASTVTVSVTANATSAAIVNPKALTFDNTNHNTAQSVRVVGVPGGSSAETFNVEYTTTSDDDIYAGLSDSWEYNNNRAATESLSIVNQGDRQETAPRNGSKSIDLQVAGSLEGNTVLAMPFHGTLSWSGPNVVYTPDTDYLGNDSFAFAVNTGGTLTRGYIDIAVEDVPEVKIVESGGTTDVVEGGATDTYTVFLDEAPLSSVTVTISTDSQVSVAPISLTFTTGNWSDPQPVVVTAVDDGAHELIHNGTVSHTTSSTDPNWDGVQVNNVTPTITDDDNQLPVVDAGTNQMVILDLSSNWTPAEIATYSWYDANDAPTIIESGGAISQWNDKSGNNRNATQSNGAKQPTTGTRTIGGLNALNFDATEDFDVPSFDLIGKECWTVINKDTANDFHVLGSSGNVQVGVLSSGKMRIWPSFSSDTQSSTLIAVGSDYFLGFRAVNPKTYSINGTEEATANTPTAALTINHIMENQYAHDSDGLIGEIVITAGELSTEDMQRMEGYLAWKWGMEANLPVGHPHKAATPGNPGVIVSLDGDVSDPDTDPLTTIWSLFSGPSGATVTFGDASAVDTTATFTEPGIYVLRLTADDSLDQSFAAVTITVNDPSANVTVNHSVPHSWLATIDPTWTNSQEAIVMADPDGDGFTTWEEYWAGTNPTNGNSFLKIDAVSYDGVSVELEWQHADVDAGIPAITIEAATNLVTGPWFPAGTKAPINGANVWAETASQVLFYRLAVPTAP